MSETKRPYQYFDTPVGEDVSKKLWFVFKPTLVWSAGLGIAEVMLVSHPKGYMPIVGRMAYVMSPFIVASTVFVCASNLSASIRKKDDRLNWFVSGFASGTVFGMWRKKTFLGFNIGMALGLAAVIKKMCLENGWTLSPRKMPMEMVIMTQDWTLMQDRPKSYITKKPDC